MRRGTFSSKPYQGPTRFGLESLSVFSPATPRASCASTDANSPSEARKLARVETASADSEYGALDPLFQDMSRR